MIFSPRIILGIVVKQAVFYIILEDLKADKYIFDGYRLLAASEWQRSTTAAKRKARRNPFRLLTFTMNMIIINHAF